MGPQKDLAFYQPAVPVSPADGLHLPLQIGVLGDGLQIAPVLGLLDGKGDGDLASLHSPFQTNQGGMDAVGAGNLRDLRQLCVRYVPGVPVPFGTGGGTDGAVADGLNPWSSAYWNSSGCWKEGCAPFPERPA